MLILIDVVLFMRNFCRNLLYIGIIFPMVMCTQKENWEVHQPGEETLVNLDFLHKSFEEVEIRSKATLDIRQESRVLNVYVYLFTSTGQRIYSHFFNSSNRESSVAAVTGADANCWYSYTDDDGNTTGTIRIKSPKISNAVLYLVANLDEDMLNVSSERLNTVQTLSELEELTVDLTQHTTSRNGYFPMVSKLADVTVTDSEIQTGGRKAYLERLDSKITVNVKLGNNTELKAFIPDKCVIRNLPSGSRVVNTSASDYEDAGYFDSQVAFDEQSTNGEGNITEATCSFYMLENRESANAKNSVDSYHNRDKRIKNSDGSYNVTDGLWLNAPEKGTYIELHGEIHMEINTSATGMQELIGNVVYYIHLGDFKTNLNDYDVERNTHYTYNVTIHGVDDIRVEVESNVENQSGATGHVYSATESHYTFDAHYGQRVFSFKAEEIGTEEMTFYVNTPFGREGTPQLPGGGYNVSDLDYKWVKFLVNEVDGSTGAYSSNNRVYPGDNNEMLVAQGKEERLMDVAELLQFVKEEKEKYTEYKNSGYAGENPSRFLKGSDGVYLLNVTAFVNEYFYGEHPTENSAISWKDFVNKPNRLMHILCSTKTSQDGASSVTGSIITIRQRSIQSPYNIGKADLVTAFGCETVDETRDDNLSFYENDDDYTNVDFGNSSTNNGLYNTACLWNLFTSGSPKTGSDREKWDTYMNYNVPNRSDDKPNHFMRNGMECMRYAAMSRNRDNNGNGYIDPEEVRWYIAPIEQLYTLYVGDLGISSEAQLYPLALGSLPNSQVDGRWQWRNHIVCSNKTTITNSGQYVSRYWPDMLWAEEGVSISGYGQEWQKVSPKSIRCIRNLGMDDASVSTIADMDENIPQPMIVVTGPASGVYRFDLTNMNSSSVRFYTTHELIPNNEYGESSRTYYGFETDDGFVSYTQSYSQLKEDLENGESPCPAGYRVPNVREAALMSLFCSANWWDNMTILCSSYYSHGSLGGNLYYDNGTITWYIQKSYVTISSSANSLRCVRDII